MIFCLTMPISIININSSCMVAERSSVSILANIALSSARWWFSNSRLVRLSIISLAAHYIHSCRTVFNMRNAMQRNCKLRYLTYFILVHPSLKKYSQKNHRAAPLKAKPKSMMQTLVPTRSRILLVYSRRPLLLLLQLPGW